MDFKFNMKYIPLYYYYIMVIFSIGLFSYSVIKTDESIVFTPMVSYHNGVDTKSNSSLVFNDSLDVPKYQREYCGYINNDTIYDYHKYLGSGEYIYFFGNHGVLRDGPNSWGGLVKDKEDEGFCMVFWLLFVIGGGIMIIRIIVYNNYESGWRASHRGKENILTKYWIRRSMYFIYEFGMVFMLTSYTINYFLDIRWIIIGLIYYLIFIIMYYVIEDDLDTYLYKKLKQKNKTNFFYSEYEKLNL